MKTKEDLDYDVTTPLMGYSMVEDAKSLGPEGEIEAARKRGGAQKASERRGVDSLKDSWDWKVQNIDDGVSIQLTSTAPHAKWVVHGTIAHRIPLQGDAKPLLSFFWESRVGATGRQWGPKGEKHEGQPSWRKFKWVDHPGALPNPFLGGVKERTRQRDTKEVAKVYEFWLTKIHKDSGFKVL